MTSTGQLIPMSAAQQWEAAKRPARTYKPDFQTASGHPLRNVQVTRPIAPWGPSYNTNEIPFRGWNQSGLNTYPIPRHDTIQMGLFNRFVLHNPDAFPAEAAKNSLLGRAQQNIQKRYPTSETSGGNASLPLPLRYRHGFGGQTNVGTQSMGSGGSRSVTAAQGVPAARSRVISREPAPPPYTRQRAPHHRAPPPAPGEAPPPYTR